MCTLLALDANEANLLTPGQSSCSTGGQSSGAESDPDFGSDYDKNFSENGSTSSLEIDTSGTGQYAPAHLL